MAIDFKKWNEQFGGTEAVKELEEVKNNAGGDFEELPDGSYICKLEKLELGESKTHKPMVKAMFRIVHGEHKKQCLFYNGVMAANDRSKSGYCIHNVLKFLRSMNVFEENEIDFDGNFETFNDLLLDISEEAQGLKFEVEKSMDGEYSRLEVVDTYD